MSSSSSPLPTSSDFGDWLNPMLVKELRQGLKTHVFVGVFVLIQAAMILLVGFRLLASGTEDAADTGEWLDGVLWFSLGLTMLLILPMRGLHSISEETKQNTLDLVQLTHLGALRIVTGKWIALVGQILLLTVAVLPYAVLRYFFGGVDVVSNLTALAMMQLASLVISAACIMLSTLPVVTRSLITGLVFFSFFSSGFGFMIRASFGGSLFGGSPVSMIAAPICAVLATAFLLSLAASRIASAAENFALVLRGIALLAVVIALLAVQWNSRSDLWIAFPWVIGIYAIFEALTERTSELPSLYAPLARRGNLCRLLGRIFYPGWATGVVFAALTITLLFVLTGMRMTSSEIRHMPVMGGFCFLAVLFPLPMLLKLPWIKQPGWFYVLAQGLGLLVFAMGRMIAGIRDNNDPAVAVIDSLTPLSALLSLTTTWPSGKAGLHGTLVPLLGLSIGGVIFLWLLFKAKREFALIGRMEREALQSLAEKTATAS